MTTRMTAKDLDVLAGADTNGTDSNAAVTPESWPAYEQNTGQLARSAVYRAIHELEAQRVEVARVYARLTSLDGGTTVEHELGESLTCIRKALVRLRKAQGELVQLKLPMAKMAEAEDG